LSFSLWTQASLQEEMSGYGFFENDFWNTIF